MGFRKSWRSIWVWFMAAPPNTFACFLTKYIPCDTIAELIMLSIFVGINLTDISGFLRRNTQFVKTIQKIGR